MRCQITGEKLWMINVMVGISFHFFGNYLFHHLALPHFRLGFKVTKYYVWACRHRELILIIPGIITSTLDWLGRITCFRYQGTRQPEPGHDLGTISTWYLNYQDPGATPSYLLLLSSHHCTGTHWPSWVWGATARIVLVEVEPVNGVTSAQCECDDCQ